MKFLIFIAVIVPIVFVTYRLTRDSLKSEWLFVVVAAGLQAIGFASGWSDLTGHGGIFVYLFILPVVIVLFAVELMLLLQKFSRLRATAFLGLVAVQFAALALTYYFASLSL